MIKDKRQTVNFLMLQNLYEYKKIKAAIIKSNILKDYLLLLQATLLYKTWFLIITELKTLNV